MDIKIKFLTPDELNVGDEVGVVDYIQCGWGKTYRYPMIFKKTVDRISPKRKSFVIGDRMYNERDICSNICEYDDNARKITEKAKVYLEYSKYKNLVEYTKDKYGDQLLPEYKYDDEAIAALRDIYERLYKLYVLPAIKRKDNE